jgi:hypothetical protein
MVGKWGIRMMKESVTMKIKPKTMARYFRRLWAALLNKPILLSNEELHLRAKQQKEWKKKLEDFPQHDYW